MTGKKGTGRTVKGKLRILLILLAAAVLLGAYGGYRLVRHEQQQSARIAGLTQIGRAHV